VTKNTTGTVVITGTFSYTGKYTTRLLLARGSGAVGGREPESAPERSDRVYNALRLGTQNGNSSQEIPPL
jgi:hypothetical protein